MVTAIPVKQSRSGRKVVKGTYLAAIQNHVSTLDMSDRFLFNHGEKFNKLIAAICKLHPNCLGEMDAQGIIYRLCYSFATQNPGHSGLLSDPKNSQLNGQLVEKIKNYLETIPKRYTVRIELPSMQNWGAANHFITNEISLVTGADVFASEQLRLGALRNRVPPARSSYLQFKIVGYATSYPESNGMSDCISLAKQTAFVLDIADVFQQGWSGNSSRCKLTDEDAKEEWPVSLPSSLSSCFGKMLVNESNLLVQATRPAGLVEMYSTASALGVGRPRIAETDEEKRVALTNRMHVVAKFFGSNRHPDFKSIAAAMEWYQDSMHAENQTFSYLAACIGLEALIGSETSITEMSKRLGDRYAFLIGKGRQERERLVKQYEEVLKLRGKLVHAKASKLLSDDRKLLQTVQQMLRQAISHEMHVMYLG